MKFATTPHDITHLTLGMFGNLKLKFTADMEENANVHIWCTHFAYVIVVISLCYLSLCTFFNRYLVLDIADNPLESILKFFQPVFVTFDIQFVLTA